MANTLLLAEVGYVAHLGISAVAASVEASQWLWQQQTSCNNRCSKIHVAQAPIETAAYALSHLVNFSSFGGPGQSTVIRFANLQETSPTQGKLR